MSDKSASEQINDIIKKYGGWKGWSDKAPQGIIKETDPNIAEEIKWKMPTRPEGWPVWVHDGIISAGQPSLAAIYFI